MIYNWNLEQVVSVVINGESYTFDNNNNPYDLSKIINDPWVNDVIARGYFVSNNSKDTAIDSGVVDADFE